MVLGAERCRRVTVAARAPPFNSLDGVNTEVYSGDCIMRRVVLCASLHFQINSETVHLTHMFILMNQRREIQIRILLFSDIKYKRVDNICNILVAVKIIIKEFI